MTKNIDIEQSLLLKFLRDKGALTKFKKNMDFSLDKCILSEEDAIYESFEWSKCREGETFWAELQGEFRDIYLLDEKKNYPLPRIKDLEERHIQENKILEEFLRGKRILSLYKKRAGLSLSVKGIVTDSRSAPIGSEIGDSFMWSGTPEGGTFWNNVDTEYWEVMAKHFYEGVYSAGGGK